MRGPSDPPDSFGLGKKVEPRPVIKPDWRKRPDLGPHIYESTQADATGHRKLRNSPPVPDCPSHPTPFDIWAAEIQKALQDAQLPTV